MPAGGHLVELMIAGFESGKTAVAVRCLLDFGYGIVDDRVDLRDVALHGAF